MRGELVFPSRSPNEAADAFLDTLKHKLLELDPATLYFDPPEVIVGGGYRRGHYLAPPDLLTPITTATIRVTPSTKAVLVSYAIRFTQSLWVSAILFLFLFLEVWLETASSSSALLTALLLGGGCFVLSYASTSHDFPRFLREVAQSVERDGRKKISH